MPPAHINLLKNAHWWLEFDQKLFVHGGFDLKKPLRDQSLQMLTWDRDLLAGAWEKHLRGENFEYPVYQEIFIGHTTTEIYKTTEPLHLGNLWNLDTGAGWAGKLTIMDITTHQYWQSDLALELYPSMGRKSIEEYNLKSSKIKPDQFLPTQC